MRKIIGFKLALRIKEIQRRAKKAKFDLDAAGLKEPELQGLLDRAQKTMKPAVLFETFPHPDGDQVLLSPLPGLAYSLILASLGPGLAALKEQEIQANPSQQPIWAILEETGLEEAVRFVTSLLEDEAGAEACELSPINPLGEAAALEAALKKLEGSKIGVGLAEGRLDPAASLALSLSWLSKSKAKGKPRA